MNKELVDKMLAGLSDAEKAEVIASLNGTGTTAVATPAVTVPVQPATVPVEPVAVQTPAPVQAAAPALPVAPAVPGIDVAALQAQLATERSSTHQC
jgi:hypothetical protein